MFARLGIRHAVLGMGWSIGLAVTLLSASPARAQNWSFDARNVALGGVGSTSNVAADMVDEQRKYRAIVLAVRTRADSPEPAESRSDQGRLRLRPGRRICNQPDPLHRRARHDKQRSAVHDRPAERRAEPGPEHVSRVRSGHRHRGRRARLSELGEDLQVPEARQWIISGRLRRRRSVLLREHIGKHRPGARRSAGESYTGLRSERALLHDQRHAESIGAGDHGRLSRAHSPGRIRLRPLRRWTGCMSVPTTTTSAASPTSGSSPTPGSTRTRRACSWWTRS
jgi:hypothetical protein